MSVCVPQIPGLVQLKQRQSVKFLGVDSLISFQNGSHKELFVPGGLVIPDDDVLDPDVITHGGSAIRMKQNVYMAHFWYQICIGYSCITQIIS